MLPVASALNGGRRVPHARRPINKVMEMLREQESNLRPLDPKVEAPDQQSIPE